MKSTPWALPPPKMCFAFYSENKIFMQPPPDILRLLHLSVEDAPVKIIFEKSYLLPGNFLDTQYATESDPL